MAMNEMSWNINEMSMKINELSKREFKKKHDFPFVFNTDLKFNAFEPKWQLEPKWLRRPLRDIDPRLGRGGKWPR